MQNIHDVLRQKEQQMEQLQKEIDALKLAIKIMENTDPGSKPVASSASAGQGDTRSAATVKHFP